MCIERPCHLSRRGTVAGLAAWIGAGSGLLASASEAAAQISNICDFSGLPGVPAKSRFRPPSARGAREVEQIRQAIGLQLPLDVVMVPEGNAMAFRDQVGARVHLVVAYNPVFLDALKAAGGPFSSLSVLAHEVGHHANGDTTWRSANVHPWARELGADFASGFALARLGASAEQALQAVRLMFTRIGSPSHPDSPRRMDAIHAGWRRGGGNAW